MKNEENKESLVYPKNEPEKPNGDFVIASVSADEAIVAAEKQVEKFKKITVISLKMTTYRDWVDQNNSPYLIESGASKIAKLWGVDFSINKNEMGKIQVEREFLDDDLGKYYSYTASGRAYSKILKCAVEDIGTCSQRDKFFAFANGKWKLPSETDETNIKKASVTNLYNRLLKRLCGLNNLTYEQLGEAGIDTSKIQKVEYGKGSQKAEATLTKKDVETRQKLWDICINMAAGAEDEAKFLLKRFTTFPKDGKELFRDDIKKLTSGKWIHAAYGKAKRAQQEADAAIPEGEQGELGEE